MISEKPTDNSNVMREHDLVSSSSPAIQGLEGIRYRLRGASTKEKVDALLEAFQYGHKGIDLVIQASIGRWRQRSAGISFAVIVLQQRSYF